MSILRTSELNVEINRGRKRTDTFGVVIGEPKKKHKICFNEKVQVFCIENFKKYNSEIYNDGNWGSQDNSNIIYNLPDTDSDGGGKGNKSNSNKKQCCSVFSCRVF
jgi:hypothetical protein